MRHYTAAREYTTAARENATAARERGRLYWTTFRFVFFYSRTRLYDSETKNCPTLPTLLTPKSGVGSVGSVGSFWLITTIHTRT